MTLQLKPIMLSEEGFAFMTQPSFDSFKPKPYRDPGNVWTIGYGQVITAEEVQKYAGGITKDEAKGLFDKYVKNLGYQLNECPFYGFDQHQWDAIFSLAYNIGFGRFTTSEIYKRLAIRSEDLSPWKWFVKDQLHRVDPGLVIRRVKELKLFIYGDYGLNGAKKGPMPRSYVL